LEGLFISMLYVFHVLDTTNWIIYTLNMYFEFFSLAEIQVFFTEKPIWGFLSQFW